MCQLYCPTRNRPLLLREALASIRKLEGSDLQFEIIVGDNGNAPESRAVAEEFGARHISVDQIGAGAARNAAMGVATGDYLAFLDDDDVWLPEHLRPQLSLLDRRPELAEVVGQVVLTDPQLVPFAEPPWPAALPDDGLLFFSSSVTSRKSVQQWRGSQRAIASECSTRHYSATRTGIGTCNSLAPERVGFVQVPCVLFRQRAPGDEDELQKRRMHFTRKVFMRHALPAWREWDSPIVFLKYFNKSMSPYFNYFRGALHRRAERGTQQAYCQPWAGCSWLAQCTPRAYWRRNGEPVASWDKRCDHGQK